MGTHILKTQPPGNLFIFGIRNAHDFPEHKASIKEHFGSHARHFAAYILADPGL